MYVLTLFQVALSHSNLSSHSFSQNQQTLALRANTHVWVRVCVCAHLRITNLL